MKLSLKIEFKDFLSELSEKAKAIEEDKSLLPEKKASELNELVKINYLVACQIYPERVKEILNRFKVGDVLNELGEKVFTFLNENNMEYNVFYDLGVIQTIKDGLTYHEKLVSSEELLLNYFKVDKSKPENLILLGFIAEPKNNEVFQLGTMLFP